MNTNTELNLNEAFLPFTNSAYKIGDAVYVDLQKCTSKLTGVNINLHSKKIFNNIAIITGMSSTSEYMCNIGQKLLFAPKYTFEVTCPVSAILGKVPDGTILYYNIEYKVADAQMNGVQKCIVRGNMLIDCATNVQINEKKSSGYLKNGALRVYGKIEAASAKPSNSQLKDDSRTIDISRYKQFLNDKTDVEPSNIQHFDDIEFET